MRFGGFMKTKCANWMRLSIAGELRAMLGYDPILAKRGSSPALAVIGRFLNGSI